MQLVLTFVICAIAFNGGVLSRNLDEDSLTEIITNAIHKAEEVKDDANVIEDVTATLDETDEKMQVPIILSDDKNDMTTGQQDDKNEDSSDGMIDDQIDEELSNEELIKVMKLTIDELEMEEMLKQENGETDDGKNDENEIVNDEKMKRGAGKVLWAIAKRLIRKVWRSSIKPAVCKKLQCPGSGR